MAVHWAGVIFTSAYPLAGMATVWLKRVPLVSASRTQTADSPAKLKR